MEIRKKKAKYISAIFFSVPRYTWPLSMCIQNLKILSLTEAVKFMTDSLPGKKEKLSNIGNDKQLHANSLLHNTTSHTQHLYHFFKILGAVIPEKSLTQISLCITLE